MAKRTRTIPVETNMGRMEVPVADLDPMKLGYICTALGISWLSVKHVYPRGDGHLFDRGTIWANDGASRGEDITQRARAFLVEQLRDSARRRLIP